MDKSIWDNLEEVTQDNNGQYIPVNGTVNTSQNSDVSNGSIWDNLEEVQQDNNGQFVSINNPQSIEPQQNTVNTIPVQQSEPLLNTNNQTAQNINNFNNALIDGTDAAAKGAIDWWKGHIRPAHFLGDLGKATANGFREESILGANAITGSKNWLLDKVGLQSWHRPTEEVKQEREDIIPKFELNEDAKVANFIGDMIGWAPSFAVGGEGVAAAKGGVAATKTGLQALLRGKKYSDMAKILARKSSIDAIKNSGKVLTKGQKFLNGVGDLAKSANNAGLDMAAFEGLRHELRRLGGDEQENTLGQDLANGYMMGAPIGAGVNVVGKYALAPLVKASLNSKLGKATMNYVGDKLNTLKKWQGLNELVSNPNALPTSVENEMNLAGQLSHKEGNAMYKKLKYGTTEPRIVDEIAGGESTNSILRDIKERAAGKRSDEPIYYSQQEYEHFINQLKEQGIPEGEILDVITNNNIRIEGDTKAPSEVNIPDNVYNDMDEFSGNAEPKQPEQPKVQEPQQEVLQENTLNSNNEVKQTSKDFVRETRVSPEDYSFLIDELMNNGKTQEEAVEFLNSYNIVPETPKVPLRDRIKKKKAEFIPEETQYDNSGKAIEKELPVEQPQGDLSTPKQETDINTPKEDLTHVNEPSTSSNEAKPQKITSYQKRMIKNKLYAAAVDKNGNPVLTKYGKQRLIKHPRGYLQDESGNVIINENGNPIPIPSAKRVFNEYHQPLDKPSEFLKDNLASNETTTTKLESGKAEGADSLNNRTTDKHENIYKNVEKEVDYSETNPASYSDKTINELKKNYELMPDGETVVKKGKNKNVKLNKVEINKLKKDLQKEYDANEKYRYDEEYTDNTFDKYADHDIWEEGKEPTTLPEYVKPQDKEFNTFYNKFKAASEEEQASLLKKEFERRGGTKESFNELYKDVLDQAERDRIINSKPELGKDTYYDKVSEDFYRHAENLGKTIEQKPHEIKRKVVTPATPKERHTANKVLYKILRQNGIKVGKFEAIKNLHKSAEHRMNAYPKDVAKAQTIYDKYFDALRNSSTTGRMRDILFDDLEMAADNYTKNTKNLIKRRKDISGDKIKANKILDKLETASDAEAEELLSKENKWLLKKQGKYNGNDIVSEHYAKRSERRVKEIMDLANPKLAVEREIEKANRMSPKWRKQRLEVIEQTKDEIIAKSLEKARKLWKRSKGFIENSYKDFSKRDRYAFKEGKRVETGDSWDTESSGTQDYEGAWKRLESKIEGLLAKDKAKDIGKHLLTGKGLENEIGTTTNVRDILRKFPKQFNSKLKKLLEPFSEIKVKITDLGRATGRNIIDKEILLSKGATFKTFVHEIGHSSFDKAARENSFIMEHRNETVKNTNLLKNFYETNTDALNKIEFKLGKKGINQNDIDKLISSGKISSDEGELLKKLSNHYNLYKTCCEELYCDMLASGEYTGTVEKFVKTYNEVFPKWLEGVKKGDIEGNGRTIKEFIKQRLSRRGRAATEVSKHNETYKDFLRERKQITETDVKGEVERELALDDIKFNSDGTPSNSKAVEEVLDMKSSAPKEMSETFNKVHDAISSYSKVGEDIAIKNRWITPEQAANRKKMQGGGIYFKQGTNGLTAGADIGSQLLESRANKQGLSGKKVLNGLAKKGTTSDIVLNTAKEAYRRINASDVVEYCEKNFAKPLEDKVPEGYSKVNKYALSFARYMGYGDEFLQAVMKGDAAIDANYGHVGDGGFAKGLKLLRKEWVKDGEYQYTLPNNVKNFILDEHGETFSEYFDRYIKNNPLENGGVKGSGWKAKGKLLGAVNDFYLERFKRGVLTSSSFFVNNRIGNQMMIAAHADNPIEYLKSFYHAAKMSDKNLPLQLRETIISDTVNGKTTYKVDTGIGWLDTFANLCRGNYIPLKSKTSIGGKAIAAAENVSVAAPNRLFNKISDAMSAVNQACENFERKQAMYIKSGKVLKEHAKLIPQTARQMEALPKLMKAIENNPELELSVVNSVEDMLGNYRSFNKYEKNFCKRIVPFYSWFRTMLRHETKLFKQNPTRWGMIHYELLQLAKDNEARKDYQQNAFNTGLKEGGKRILINKGAQIPYNTFKEVVEDFTGGKNPVSGFNPLTYVPIEAFRARKFFLNEELQDHRYRRGSHWDNELKEMVPDKKVYDMKDKRFVGENMPASTRLAYAGKKLGLPTIYPFMQSPLSNLEYWGSGLYNVAKGNGWKTPDKYYDTGFYGYNSGDKYKIDGKENLHYAANDLSEGYKLSNRLFGTTFQKERDLNKDEQKELKEKRAKWREKHKRRK